MSNWIHILSRVTFDISSLNTAPATVTSGGGSGGSARTSEREAAVAEQRMCSSLLSRCLAARNAANAVVSKFLELKIDDGGGGGGAETGARHLGSKKGGDSVAGGGSVRGGWGGVGAGSSAAFGAEKAMLQIHLADARAGGDDGDR